MYDARRSRRDPWSPVESRRFMSHVPSLPFLQPELFRRIDALERTYMTARLRGLQGLMDVRIESFGGAVAHRVLGRAESFNQVFGLESSDSGVLDEIESFFGQDEFVVHVLPLDTNTVLFRQLVRRGYAPVEADAMFYGDPSICGQEPENHRQSGLSIRALDSGDPDQLEAYADLLARAWENPKEKIPQRRAELVGQYAAPQWRCFLAEHEGAPVGAAALFLAGRDGALEMCATLPQSRRLGVQGALLRARMRAAAAAGCALVASTPFLFSSSQRNLERSGLRLAYHKTLWAPQRGLSDE